jgi:MHS family proline/betaine transporter-like MFS transporter
MLSGMLGNGLEWYDYALYGHMTIVISKLFFPSEDASFSVILTLLTFAVGFLARPLGAVLFGRIGDKYGRKKALVTSMILMAIPTGLIGLLPTYEMVGIAAPISLLLIRILQGLSLGGAYGGAISYVVEHSPSDKRGLAGSVIMASLVIGFLFGSLVSTAFSSLLSEADFMSWGWRVPFFLGVGIGIVGFYIRAHGEESPIYEQAQKNGTLSQTPVKDVFCKYPSKMLQGFSIYLFVTIPFYLIGIYMITFVTRHIGFSASDALQMNVIAMGCMFVSIIPAAKLADKIGRKPVLIAAILVMMAILFPAFEMLHSGDYLLALLAQCMMALVLGAYLAPIPAMLVELFPTSVRYTGLSLSYNFCAILGGFTPAFSEYLIRQTGNTQSIIYLIIASAVASIISLIVYKDRWREPLI